MHGVVGEFAQVTWPCSWLARARKKAPVKQINEPAALQ